MTPRLARTLQVVLLSGVIHAATPSEGWTFERVTIVVGFLAGIAALLDFFGLRGFLVDKIRGRRPPVRGLWRFLSKAAELAAGLAAIAVGTWASGETRTQALVAIVSVLALLGIVRLIADYRRERGDGAQVPAVVPSPVSVPAARDDDGISKVAPLFGTELRDIRLKIERWRATRYPIPYENLPAFRWDEHADVLVATPEIYAAVERAYDAAHQANQNVHDRERQPRPPGRPFAPIPTDGLDVAHGLAGEALDALGQRHNDPFQSPRQRDPGVRSRRAMHPRPKPVDLPTPAEAMDVYIEKEGIAPELASRMRIRTAEYMGEIEAERPEHLRRQESATRLLDEGASLEKRLWVHRRDMVRSQQGFLFKGLPAAYTAEVKDWNGRVLAFADEHMTVKDAGEVTPYPGVLLAVAALGGPSVEIIERLLANNMAALHRIKAMK